MSLINLFKYIGIALILTFLTSLSGGWHWKYQFIAVGLGFYFASFWLCKGTPQKEQLLIIGILTVVYQLLLHLIGYYPGILPTIVLQIIAVLAGFLTARQNLPTLAHWKPISFSITILALGMIGMPNWLSWYNNQNLQPLEGSVSLELIDDQGNHINTERDLQSKIIVLDFWTSGCGVCFQKFSKFESVYKNYKHRSDIQFYAVKMPHEREALDRGDHRTDPYSFPTVRTAKFRSELKEEWDIEYVPMVIIIDRQGRIAYQGDFCTNPVEYCYLEKKIKELLES